MTEPLFPRFTEADLREPPRVIVELWRVNGWMLFDLWAVLSGLVMLVIPGIPIWHYAIWLLVVAIGAVLLNWEIRLAMRGVKL